MAHKNKNIRHPIVDPPFEHVTQPAELSPTTAQKSIAAFLKKSESHPYLHPDSFLANTGIRFAIGSGPKGGIALHHLRRIEAGLRGEFLEQETPEQLEALFGEQYRARGDDRILNGLIDQSERNLWRERKAKKRKREEIEDWVSTSSQAREEQDRNDQLRGYVYHHHEIESFANTPLHQPSYEEIEQLQDTQDPYDYELNQRVWTKDPQSGEDGAVGTMVKQGGSIPPVVQHDEDGNVILTKKERKEAKKRRQQEKKMELARENEVKRAEKSREKDNIAEDGEEKTKEERKAEKKATKKREREQEEVSGARDTHEGEETRAKEARRAERKAQKKEEKRRRESNGTHGAADDDDEEAKRAERKRRKKEKKEKKARKESS